MPPPKKDPHYYSNGGLYFWRWVAATLIVLLLAGAPGYVHLYMGPTKEQVDRIGERQQDVLQRLGILEQKQIGIEEEIAQIRAELLRHTDSRADGRR